MRKGFFNGIITGGILSAVLMMLVAPQFKKERKHFMRDTKQVRNKTRRVIKGVKNVTDDWMK